MATKKVYLMKHPSYIREFGEFLEIAEAKKKFNEAGVKSLLAKGYIAEGTVDSNNANNTTDNGNKDKQEESESK